MGGRLFTSAVLATLVMTFTGACAKKQVQPPAPSDRSLVVLLPEADGKTSGQATVTGGSTVVDLDGAREATQVSTGQPPSTPTPIQDENVQRIFGSTIAGLPPAAQHFTLYFRLDSDELTAESKGTVPEIRRAVEARAVPEVTIIGHTDTTGSAANNLTLGLKRAATVRALLLATGVDPALVETASHGEAEPLVHTPDETNEPRNRRVEIVIR